MMRNLGFQQFNKQVVIGMELMQSEISESFGVVAVYNGFLYHAEAVSVSWSQSIRLAIS